MLTPGSSAPSPDFLTATLRSGISITMRPLQREDSARLGDYFANLSAATRARYGPHPFDQAAADAICATLAPTDILRMVATVADNGDERIIAYVLLKHGVWGNDLERYERLGIPLHPETDSTLAPSVADDYQNQGLGSLIIGYLFQVARELGRQRIVLWGGVQATNDRAVHCYTKWGFVKVGEFYTDKNNFDMILDLRADQSTVSSEESMP